MVPGPDPISWEMMDPDPTDPDPDPTDPGSWSPTRPDLSPCSASSRPRLPSNKYRFDCSRALTRKKLTPPDLQ